MEPLSRPGFLFAVLLIISLGACGSTEVTPSPLGAGGSGGSAGHGGGGAGGSGGTEDGAGGTDGEGGTGGVAAGCSGHEGCPSSLPYCGSDRACHACLLDAHCPLDHPWCDDGACKLCEGDEACTDRGVCNPETGACVECRDDEHCDDGRCTEDRRCVECLDGEDCDSGVCEEGVCLAGARCSNTQPCEEGVCFAEDDNAVEGICHPRCDPVTQTGCEEGLVCAFHSAGPSGPVGGCLPPDGGLSVGEDCSGGESCELGLLCVTIFTERICSAFCDPDVPDVCGQGMVCERLSVRDQPDAVLAVCVEEDRPCQKDSDCEEGEACTLFVTGGGQEVGMVCIKAAGTGLGGDPCARGADCASGVCLTPQNTCFGGCATSDDCSENGACIVLSIGANRFNGCVASCEHESDCGNGQGCMLTLSPDRSEVVSICNPSSKPVASGEICTGDTCRSGSCFKLSAAAPEGYCSAPCGGDEHCGQFTECADSWYTAPGLDNVVGTADDSKHNIPTCSGIRCERKSDCPQNWECLPGDNGGLGEDGAVELRCRPGVPGAPRGGEPCGPGCLCTTFTGRAGSFCFEPCTATADCSGNFECIPDAHRRTGANGQAWTFDACLPLP